jgi:hypothetical protein
VRAGLVDDMEISELLVTMCPDANAGRRAKKTGFLDAP